MSALEFMAQQMQERLNSCRKGYIHRVLFGGLHVLLERRHDTWRLAIARIGKVPSQVEVDTVARDFGVPTGIEWSYGTRPVKRGKQPRLTYHVRECTWIDREEPHP